MAYVAMARKWRPNSFEDLVGQEHIAKTFRNAIEGGRLHHAFLFTGTRGTGKTTTARILARTLNCSGENPLVPCGECPSCKDIASDTAMDVLEIDAASNTSVDNVRDILERVQYPPMIGKFKVFIIDEVHMLSTGAFNALLKTLEEPPSHVIFIFATTEINKVPQTILSRVQRFDFKRLSPTQIIGRLKYICEREHIEPDDESLSILADKADGSMRDALTYFDQVYAFSGSQMNADSVRSVLGIPPNELYFSLIDSIEKRNMGCALQVVEKASSLGVEYAPFLDGFAKFLRNLLYIRAGSATPDFLNLSKELFEKLSSAGKSLSTGDLLRIAKLTTDTQGSLRYSPNPRLLTETALARMAWLDHLTDLRRVLSSISKNADGEVKKKVVEREVFQPPNFSKNDFSNSAGISTDFQSGILNNASSGMSNSFSSGVSNDFQSDVLNNSFSQAPKENFSNSLDDVKIFDDFDLGKVDPLPLSYPQYSRASFLSSWHEVKRLFDEDGDMLFAASLEGSSVSSPAENDTPFPLKLSFRNNGDGSPSWAFQQFTSEHPEFQTRLKTRLEDILQTKISLSLHRYTPSKEELAAQNKKLSAYEIDLEKNTHLQALKRLFNVELIGTRKIAPDLRIQQMPEE